MTLAVAIDVADPRDAYLCGDVIQGTVSILPDSTAPVLVNDLLIQLLCKVTTRTRGPEQWTGATRLGEEISVSIPYCFVHRLVESPTRMTSSDRLDFEFTIPTESKLNDIEPSWKVSNIFENDAGHAIPPTWKGDRYGRARVVHQLEVVLHESEEQEYRRHIKTKEIKFSSCRSVANPDGHHSGRSRKISVKVPKSLIHNQDPLGWKRKGIVQLLTPEEKQHVSLQVETLCPSVLYAGGPIPFFVSIFCEEIYQQWTSQRQLTPPDEEDEQSGPVTPTEKGPMIFVDGLNMYLEARTDRRIRDKRGSSEHTLFEDEMIQLCNVVDRPVVLTSQMAALHAHYPEMVIRANVLPTFRCFSLRRRYTLHVRIRLVVGGDQEHLINLKSPVMILPHVFSNTAGAIRPIDRATLGLRRRVSEETLPPYQETDPSPSAVYLDRPPPFSA